MYLDTRDLAETRDELKQQILDAFNDEFTTDYTDYSEIDFELIDDNGDFKANWEDELKQIEEIDTIENECSEFSFGETLIDEDDFEEYCEDFVNDCYGLRDIPQLIKNNIDWAGIADDMKQDYSEIEYQGNTYLYRS